MKKTIAIVFFLGLFLFSYSQNQVDTLKTAGKVSHEFKKSGCRTVIILQSDPAVILIPREKLPKAFDKNGLIIFFNYRRLRTPNPIGCVKGVPAEITNISKKK
ncbi:MAG: hypothetical protein ACXVNM_02210 [Bacteroidia bacterium]